VGAEAVPLQLALVVLEVQLEETMVQTADPVRVLPEELVELTQVEAAVLALVA
jgi:hypothetical protein